MAMRNEFLQQLNRLKIERRPEACLGCKFKHDCSLLGCAVIKEAMRLIPKWHSMEDEAPENEEMRLVACLDKAGRYSINRAWYDGEFWHGSGSMAGVTHWMELPKAPEVEKPRAATPCWPGMSAGGEK